MSLLEFAALSLHAQPAAGSILTHGIGIAVRGTVIDDQQNVYTVTSGGCGGGGFGTPEI